MATRDYSCQSKLHKEHAYGVFGFSTQRIVSPREELCCGDMSCGDFEAFVLLLLAAYCLGDLSKTNSIPLTCYSNENCEANSLCNQTCLLNQYCYAFWTNNSGNVSVSKQGCWINHDTVNFCETATCKSGIKSGIRIKKRINNYYFCCCNKDFCNDELDLDPEVYVAPNSTSTHETTTGPSTLSTVSPTTATKNKTIQTLLYSVLPIFGVAVFLVFGFFMYHRRKTSFPHIFEEPLRTLPPPSPDLGVRPIQLVEIISQGQFGTVWKADYLQDVVAVKVFPSSYKAAWACEKEIFMTRNMKHENILNFIAAEKHTDGQYVELWLVTQYHENGSLGDYLKSHVVNWRELCCMAGSMANGLAYLHTEIHETFKFKPCIAHRDFKSKNVLVKKDLTCCLSDFGLAVRFQSGGDPGEMHGQVGTRRYMAPEVLEGAINFTRESFLYIDVYAFALVLWELASRCSAVDGPVEDYQLPFEEEVGSHPSLEDMQQAVVHKKIRPRFRADWLIHPGMSNLLQTIEECWDQDAEARLTAQCVAERMTHCQMMPLLGTEQMPAITTVVNDTHIPMSSKESTI